MSVTTVAVLGAGASGCLTAAALVRGAAAAGRVLDVLVVEPDEVGCGVAYGTQDPRHRLNVPARGMSAWPDDPPHFVRWLHRHVDAGFPEGGFAPRLHYAQYLRDVLDSVADRAAGGGVRVEHVRARATDVRRHGRRLRLVLADGTSRPVDAAVLAMGAGTPSTAWAPSGLRDSPRFVADPWQPGAAPHVAADSDIVIVGAGLSAVDMALRWSRDGVRVHLVSRHGMLPLPHATQPALPRPATELPGGADLATARRFVFAHLRRVRAEGGDWREAVDGLRPVTGRMWRALDEDARAGFLGAAARRWDRVRHRLDPNLDLWLQNRRAEGSLDIHRAHVVDAVDSGTGSVLVQLSDGTALAAAAVLNCTGTCLPVQVSSDPLLMNLLASGTVRPGPVGLGVATTDGGQVLGAARAQSIWAVGPLRRGELWESTAVPEIRVQAGEVAGAVLAALPGSGIVRRPRDSYGLPVSANPPAAAHYLDALGRILRVQSGAEHLLMRAVDADPDFALGHAVLAMLGVEWGADVDAGASLAAAHRASHADERERRFIEVASARIEAPGPASAAALLAYIDSYPEDALAVSLAVPTIAFGGATELPAEAWALVEGLQPAYPAQDWWYLGMLAFVRQEQQRWDEAAGLSARALAVEPAAGHAVHAKTHVHYETGDHLAGLRWLDGWIADRGSGSSHRAHFSWHAALHELALGDTAAVRRRFSAQLAPPDVHGVRALVDSASLLWRGMVADAWPDGEPAGAVQAVLAGVDPTLLHHPPTPFVALHAAVALAAAGDCRGLARLRRDAAARDDAVFTGTVAPLADALADLVHGDHDAAADGLAQLPAVQSLGGSAAQREVVEETLLHCLMRAGRVEQAGELLDRRLHARRSPRDSVLRRSLGPAR